MADESSAHESGTKRPRKGKGGKSGDTPKAYVRLRPGAGGTWEAEVRVTGDPDAGSVATAEGFTEVPFPEGALQEYPKWVFHEDGRRKVVSNEAEEEAAEGFGTTPGGLGPDPYEGEVPPPMGDLVGAPSSTRGPVPVDRG